MQKSTTNPTTLDALLNSLVDLLVEAGYSGTNGVVTPDAEEAEPEAKAEAKQATKKALTKKAVVKKSDPREDRLAELQGLKTKALVKIASEWYEEDSLEGADKEAIIKAILTEEFANGDSADSEPEDEDDDDEGTAESTGGADDWYTEDDLEDTPKKELRRIALEEAGYDKSDIRGLDEEDLIGLIVIAGLPEYDEETLSGMSLPEVKDLARKYNITIGRKAQPRLIADILAAQAGE
jgi:hypothetical protein